MTDTETKKVCFHTNGEIDPLSWEIIGMSAKDTDNPIGQFGSGLKFAVAILLRTGHAISIHCGTTIHTFGTVSKEFRGKQFQVVTCNGKELGITTDMGGHWDLWMAYRELVSNTMDEGGIHFAGGPMEDGTSIIVEGDKFHALLSKHNDLFVGDREPLAEGHRIRIYEGNGTVFYRGVKVGAIEHAGFSYEIMDNLVLTEDRSIKDIHSVYSSILIAICRLTDKTLIQRILTMPKGKWEQQDDRDYEWTWSSEFEEVVREIWETSPSVLPKRVIRQIRSKLPDVEFKALDSEEFTAAIEKAREFLQLAGYPVTAEIKVVENTEANMIAFTHNGQIHLTERSFEKGLFDLVTTLFEEQSHILGYEDCSRSFQQYIINQLVTQARKRLKIVL